MKSKILYFKKCFMAGDDLCILFSIGRDGKKCMFTVPFPPGFTLSVGNRIKKRREMYDVAYKYDQPLRNIIIQTYKYLVTKRKFTIFVPSDYDLNMLE